MGRKEKELASKNITKGRGSGVQMSPAAFLGINRVSGTKLWSQTSCFKTHASKQSTPHLFCTAPRMKRDLNGKNTW